MECPNCNRTYDDEFKFCPYCGEKKPELKICPKCKFKSIEYSYCPHCGKNLIPIQYFKNNKPKKKNNLKNNIQKSSTKSYKIKLYDYLNSLDNVKNRIVIERRIEAGEITTKEEIDAIRMPKPIRKYGKMSVEEILEQKNKKVKHDLINFVSNLIMDNNILKEKIIKKIQEGEITTHDEINSIIENERKELIKYVNAKNIEGNVNAKYIEGIKIVIIKKIKRGELNTRNQIDNKIKNIKLDKEYIRYVATHGDSVYHKGGGSSNYYPHAKWGW